LFADCTPAIASSAFSFSQKGGDSQVETFWATIIKGGFNTHLSFVSEKKPNFTSGDLDDVTLVSPAIFLGIERCFGAGQKELSRPVAFRPHLTMGLVLLK